MRLFIQRPSLWIVAVLAACDHGEPFRPRDYAPDGPFGAGSPLRLTFNPGADLSPAWLPDGNSSRILYTVERYDRADHDRCLATLPAGGGSIVTLACRTTAADDSINAFDEAKPLPGDQIAYVRSATHREPPRPLNPDVQELVVAARANPQTTRSLKALPYTAPWSQVHTGISHIQGLTPTRLVYLAEDVSYPRPCSSCAPDTLRTGIEIVLLDFAAGSATITRVPGTGGATSVAVGASPDTIYFTRSGETSVYRTPVQGGSIDTVHTFTGIPRDVSVAAGRLAVSVDGQALYFVTLSSGAEAVVLDTTARFLRPVLSPDGTRVVVERWVGPVSDLWMVAVP
jgi:WD40-like Beta Propeller Repeat